MRLIDADALIELINGGYDLDFDEVPETKRELLRMIMEQPTVDTVPVRHGQWVTCRASDHWKCSKCGYRAPMWWNGDEDGYIEWLSDYCPNCGAKMDERKEE